MRKKPSGSPLTMLALAREEAKLAKADWLWDRQLEAIVWFAGLPMVVGLYPIDFAQRVVLDEENHFIWDFWSAWLRAPDETMRLTKRLRRRFLAPTAKEMEDYRLGNAIESNPDIAPAELAMVVLDRKNVTETQVDAVWKRRERLLKLARDEDPDEALPFTCHGPPPLLGRYVLKKWGRPDKKS